jgi:hypothetical protein
MICGDLPKTAESGSGAGSLPKTLLLESEGYKGRLLEPVVL